MGMWIYAAAAAKKKKDDRRRAARRGAAKRAKAEEEKRKLKYKSSSGESGRAHKPFLDCVMKEISYSNPKLLKFFQELEQELIEVGKLECADDVQRTRECTELVIKYASKLEELKKKLEAAGVEISDCQSYSMYTLFDKGDEFYVEKSSKGFDGVKFSRSSYLTYGSFDGMKVSLEDLSNPEESEQKRSYDRDKFSFEQLSLSESELRDMITKKERSLRFSLFGRDKRKEEIEALKLDLRVHEKTRENMEKSRAEYEKLRDLPEEKRKLIIDFLTVQKCLLESINLVENYTRNINESFRYQRPYDETRVYKALKSLMEKKGMQSEDLDKIFSTLDTVGEKRLRDEYGLTYSWSSDKDGVTNHLKPLVNTFVQHIYKPDEESLEGKTEEDRDEL